MEATQSALLKAGHYPEVLNQHRHVSFHDSSDWEGRRTPHSLTNDNNQVSFTNRNKQHGYRAGRRSLPAHGIITHEQPSILVTPVDDPVLQDRPNRSKRTSMSPNHDSKLQVETTKNRRYSSGPGPFPNHSSGATSNRTQAGESPMGMKIMAEIPRNDTPVDSRWIQHGGRHRISLGSSSALPSMSPFPVTKPKAVHVNGQRNQQKLLQNSATMHKNSRTLGGRPETRLHHGHVERHLEVANLHAESLKLASTKSNPHLNAHMDPLARPLSTPSNGLTQTPPLFRSPARNRSSAHALQEYPFLATLSGTVTGERRPRSFQPGEDTRARSSSAHSTATVLTSVSNATSHSQRSRRRYSDSRTSQSSKNRYQRQMVDQERLDALASLTGGSNRSGHRGSATAESLRLVREREKLLRWKAEREKMEFERREREKVKERVRLANLKELQRSEELEEEVKRKKKGRRCWSGIFGW